MSKAGPSEVLPLRTSSCGRALDGEGLTGQGRLIQQGGPRYHRTIDRYDLTLSNEKTVTRNEQGDRHFLEPVAAVAYRSLRNPPEQGRSFPALRGRMQTLRAFVRRHT